MARNLSCGAKYRGGQKALQFLRGLSRLALRETIVSSGEPLGLLLCNWVGGIRGEIELVRGRIQYLEDRTPSSRISLSIQPVPGAKPQPPAWSPARVVAQVQNASLGALQVLATAVLSAIVFGWWLAPLLVGGFVWWRRRARQPAATGSSEAG